MSPIGVSLLVLYGPSLGNSDFAHRKDGNTLAITYTIHKVPTDTPVNVALPPVDLTDFFAGPPGNGNNAYYIHTNKGVDGMLQLNLTNTQTGKYRNLMAQLEAPLEITDSETSAVLGSHKVLVSIMVKIPDGIGLPDETDLVTLIGTICNIVLAPAAGSPTSSFIGSLLASPHVRVGS